MWVKNHQVLCRHKRRQVSTMVGGIKTQAKPARGNDLVQFTRLSNPGDVLKILRRKDTVVVEIEGGALPRGHFAAQQGRRAVMTVTVKDTHGGGTRVIGILDEFAEDTGPLGVQFCI